MGVTARAKIFDKAETSLIERTVAALRGPAPGDASALAGLTKRVDELGAHLDLMPSLRLDEALGGRDRNEGTLINHLCQCDGLAGDLDMPLKATLSRTLLIAKVQLLRAMVKAVCGQPQDEEPFHQLNLEVREELAQSIYTQLAEELLSALLRKPDVQRSTKREAARQLIVIWDNAELEIDDFCPLLESAWHARNRVASGFGALLGASEYFRLVAEDCAPQFLDFFSRDEVSDAEEQAFEEFLFNMTYEELATLRHAMKDQGKDAVSETWAGRVLHRPIEPECKRDEIEPLALYRSYYRRQLAADFRILADAPGPRRTAEAYLLIYLLDAQLTSEPTTP